MICQHKPKETPFTSSCGAHRCEYKGQEYKGDPAQSPHTGAMVQRVLSGIHSDGVISLCMDSELSKPYVDSQKMLPLILQHTSPVRFFVCSRRSFVILCSIDSSFRRTPASGSMLLVSFKPCCLMRVLRSLLVLRTEDICDRTRRSMVYQVDESRPISWTRFCNLWRSFVKEA